MGASAKITIVDNSDNAKAAMKEAFALLNSYDAMMSYYSKTSELSQINSNAYQNPIHISLDMMEVIQAALKYGHLTDGVFDITAPALQGKVGYDTIILDSDDKTVRFSHSNTSIDLGGIVAGFSIDKVVKLFKIRGINNFLIDLGGDIYAQGKNPQGKPWNVGIRDPFHKDTIINTIKVSDEAVTTSGNYIKKHIVNPQAQNIASSDIISVTVIAKNCIDADVLATAFFIMGQNKTKEFLSRHSDIKAIFVINTNDGLKLVSI